MSTISILQQLRINTKKPTWFLTLQCCKILKLPTHAHMHTIRIVMLLIYVQKIISNWSYKVERLNDLWRNPCTNERMLRSDITLWCCLLKY